MTTPDVLYHGTTPWCVERILRRGIHPGRGHGGLVYLSEDPNIAAWWGVRGGPGPAAVFEVDVHSRPFEPHWSGVNSWCHHGTVPARLLRLLDPSDHSPQRGGELVKRYWEDDELEGDEPNFDC